MQADLSGLGSPAFLITAGGGVSLASANAQSWWGGGGGMLWQTWSARPGPCHCHRTGGPSHPSMPEH